MAAAAKLDMTTKIDHNYIPPDEAGTDVFEVNGNGPQARAGNRNNKRKPNYVGPDPDQLFQDEQFAPGDSSSSPVTKTSKFGMKVPELRLVIKGWATDGGMNDFESLTGTYNPFRRRMAKKARIANDGQGLDDDDGEDELPVSSLVSLYNDEMLGTPLAGIAPAVTADMPTDMTGLLALCEGASQGAPLWLVARKLTGTQVSIAPKVRIMVSSN